MAPIMCVFARRSHAIRGRAGRLGGWFVAVAFVWLALSGTRQAFAGLPVPVTLSWDGPGEYGTTTAITRTGPAGAPGTIEYSDTQFFGTDGDATAAAAVDDGNVFASVWSNMLGEERGYFRALFFMESLGVAEAICENEVLGTMTVGTSPHYPPGTILPFPTKWQNLIDPGPSEWHFKVWDDDPGEPLYFFDANSPSWDVMYLPTDSTLSFEFRTYDLQTDGADKDCWLQVFVPVPEPGTLALLLLGGIALTRRMRRS